MMVTFVSQCEKKALPRTRRVLDAFANRIGDNTWQTVITEEGLDAVKKLLRKTASKNTAVSCHWIRSRSRSEFIWAVGNKSRFNERGIVPVNYTSDELIRDDKKIMIDNLYANTQKQPLDQHLFAVGYVAHAILKKLLHEDYKNLSYAAFVSGCFHDLGKLDPAFQEWIQKKIKSEPEPEEIIQPEDGFHIDGTKKSKRFFDDHPRHNEISFLFLGLMFGEEAENLNKKTMEFVRHSVYWHHAKPFREKSLKDISDIYISLKGGLKNNGFHEIYYQVADVIKSVDKLMVDYLDESVKLPDFKRKLDEDFEDGLGKALPDYKVYKETDDLKYIQNYICDNARRSIVRAALVSADRLISGLTAEELKHRISSSRLNEIALECLQKSSNIKDAIKSCLSVFEAKFPGSARNAAQAKAAKELSEVDNVAVLNGPAGCGKTKIALEWAANKDTKKIIWVCPRVQVCQGIFTDLTSQEYLPNSKIEIYTSEFKQTRFDGETRETTDVFGGDIVITTIDQVVNSIITHIQTNTLIDFMDAHVVFDEYHEFINMPAFNLLFAELIACKKLRGSSANTLLVSATPNYFFVEEFLKIHRDDIKGIESFNQSKYKISFRKYDDVNGEPSPLIADAQKSSTFVITNTATDAQRGFIKNMENENAILFHSKFTKKDKQELFERVYECFKEDGSRQYDVLRSGPIVQASLNISCDKMLTEFTHAENWLQRLGRLDRFGKNQVVNEYITVLGSSIDAGKGQSNTARFLNGDNIFHSAKVWYEFLKDKDIAEKEMSINEIYSLYEEFYSNEKYRKVIQDDFMNALKKSIKVINAKILDPIRVPNRKKVQDGKARMKKQSLRGDSRFVQMAICRVSNDGKYNFPDEYAFPEDGEAGSDLTASIEEITGYGASDKSLLAYMFKKHHQIKQDSSLKAYKDFQIIDAARSPENPIYLSYTRKDLEPIGGASQAHEFAVYYVKCDKQAIGAISNDKLNLKGE